MKTTLTSLVVLLCAILKTLGADSPPIFEAIEKGNGPGVQKLLVAKLDLEARNSMGWTPLIAATQARQTEIVELLAKSGANVNARSTNGSLPLGFAAQANDTNTMAVLLKYKADVNGARPGGQTALMSAAYFGHINAAQLLLDAGADIDARASEDPKVLSDPTLNFLKHNAIDLAAKQEHPDMVKLLLFARANRKNRQP